MGDQDINFIDFIFIQFTVFLVLIGTLVNIIENYLPTAIVQSFRYGKHSYKGVPNKLVKLCEVPKSYFKHFYIFAGLWSTWILYLGINIYFRGEQAPEYFIKFIDILCGSHRKVKTTSLSAFFAIYLLFLQCIRRFYETMFVQVFSSKNKINITHYLVGYFHYFGSFLIVLSKAPGFNHYENKTVKPIMFNLNEISIMDSISIVLFLYAWMQQYKTNLILANLRKNNLGTIITENHNLPTGGYFKYVSSPHMFFEILMYIALYGILYKNTSWLFVLCWVISNQIETAWLTHKWYKTTFANYPKERYAIIPKVL